jgi:hypothetical protein
MLIPGDWIEVQVGMQFQIGSRHGRGGIQEFVYDIDGQAFLKRELWIVPVGQEFTIIQGDLCSLIYFEIILLVSQMSKHRISYIGVGSLGLRIYI